MRRWIPISLVVLGVLCAAIGAGLVLRQPPSASFGWTAYSPLAAERYTTYGAGGDPVGASALWSRAAAAGLLALGAGATGAGAASLVLRRRAGPADRAGPLNTVGG